MYSIIILLQTPGTLHYLARDNWIKIRGTCYFEIGQTWKLFIFFFPLFPLLLLLFVLFRLFVCFTGFGRWLHYDMAGQGISS